jgi:hypothetical protein
MVEDPLPDRDLPLRVGIEQQPVADRDQQHIDGNADPQRQRSGHGFGIWSDVGGGQRHGRNFPSTTGSAVCNASVLRRWMVATSSL